MKLPTPTTFGLESFDALVGLIQDSGYSLGRFDDTAYSDHTFLLRHDVDISPANALALGEITARRNARSNFFFQLNAETYNLFSEQTLAIVKRLREIGHCVGLHIDQLLLGEEEADIARTIDWFNRHVTPIDNVISFHRPTPTVVGRSYRQFINAYDPKFFNADRYLSDSRRSMMFMERLPQWLGDKRPKLQLLLHPGWWTEAESISDIWHRLRSRRENELALYVRSNFNKVFADVIEVQNRDFRI